MKAKLKKILKEILFKYPLRKYIMFESYPDFSDNSEAVYEEMLRRNLNKRYVLVWLTYEKTKKRLPFNVRQVYRKSALSKWYRNTARVIISCNGQIVSTVPQQFSIYLDHGSPFKNATKHMLVSNEITYWVAASDEMKEIIFQCINLDKSKIVALGYPRNDWFFAEQIDLHQFFDVPFNKAIVWYPTLRQIKGGYRNDSSLSIPIIHDSRQAIELNRIAKENRIIIIIKPHFLQDITKINRLDLSNIVFVDDAFFKENGITPYCFLNSTDALLTDYSSVYYDYTLHNKPIGLIWEDIDEYKERLGLIDNYNEMAKGGEKIFCFQDLVSFINRISEDKDLVYMERNEICKRTNKSLVGDNAKRVVDFIIENATLKAL